MPYIDGSRFTILTHYEAVKWHSTLPKGSDNHACSRFLLSKFKFEIVHRAVIENPAVDDPSRLSTKDYGGKLLDDDAPALVVSI